MAVPATTFEDLDLSDGWTELSSPLYVADLHNPGAAVRLDGIDDGLVQATENVWTTGETDCSFACWIRIYPQSGQRAITVNATAFVSIPLNKGSIYVWSDANGKLGTTFYSSQTNTLQSHSVNSVADTGDWLFVGCTIAGSSDDLNLYTSGVEVSYSLENSKAGTGFTTGFAGTPEAIRVGSVSASVFLNGDVSRVRYWDGTTLSAAQMLELYNAEISLFAANDATNLLLLG